MPGLENMLVGFYRDGGRDAEGRTHAEILGWDDATLEAVHDYIQWLFPLPEPSRANRAAPLLTPPVIRAFADSAEMQARLRAAWLRMLAFYGFVLKDDVVALGPNFDSRARNWLTLDNHNHLRLSRILRCLWLTGHQAESQSLLAALSLVYEGDGQRGAGRISTETFGYWQRALQ